MAKKNTESFDRSNLDKMQGKEKPAKNLTVQWLLFLLLFFFVFEKIYYHVGQDMDLKQYQFITVNQLYVRSSYTNVSI